MAPHASAQSYAAHACKETGWTAAKAERTKRTWFQKDVPNHRAFRFVPFAVESCGYMGKEAVQFVSRLGSIAAGNGRINASYSEGRICALGDAAAVSGGPERQC